MDGLRLHRCRAAGPVTAGELLFEIAGSGTRPPETSGSAAASGPAAARSGAAARSDAPAAAHALIVVSAPGLHARPAALLAQRAKAFAAQITLSAHGRSANARSVVAIMALGVRQGDELTI